MTKYEELINWIENNKIHLETYTIDELSDLAIATGMDRGAVAQWRTNKLFGKVA